MSLQCTIHVDDEVRCRVLGLHPEHNKMLWEKFGIFVDGYRFMPAFQLRRWDGKIRFFNANGTTYTKILDEIVPYLATWGYEVDLVDNRSPAPVITDRINEDFFGEIETKPNWKLRPYQVNVVNQLLEEGCGFALAATGSGKTAMCSALAMALYQHKIQTIVIVPSSDLVTQTVTEFREFLSNYDVTIGEYSGDTKEIDHPIVVATWQALQNAPHYMKYFQGCIVDEAHGAKSAVIQELINVHGSHISHRYGVTGTFPKPQTDQYALKTALGRIVCEVPAKWLIEQGYLAEIEILPIQTIDEDPKLPDYASERAWLTKNEARNLAIAREIENISLTYGNTMVLVNTQALAQGREIVDLLPNAVYLDGGSKKDVRQEEYAKYADQDGVVVVASAGIASTGLSIDRIFALVLLDTGKSFTKCIQSVGRGLRKKGDKTKIIVIDVYSKLKFSNKHYKDRKSYYNDAGYPVLPVKKLKY